MKRKPIADKDMRLTKVARKLSLLLALTSFQTVSFAATIEVTSMEGYPGCDLIEAINAANSDAPVGGCIANAGSFGDDTIILNFTVPITDFVLDSVNYSDINGPNGLPEITSNITIVGRGTELVTIRRSDIAGTPEFRLFTITQDGSLTLQNISLQNGLSSGDGINLYNGGAINNNGGQLSFSDGELSNNQAESGGAIFTGVTSSTVIRNSVLFDNTAIRNAIGNSGGAIYNSGDLIIVDSELNDNEAGNGGAMILAGGSTTVIRSSLLSENEVTLNGGAIAILDSAMVSIYDTTISGNRVVNPDAIATYGGGISLYVNNAVLSITNTTISGNQIVAPFPNGGGITVKSGSEDSTLNIVNSIVAGNQASSSGSEIKMLTGSTNELNITSSLIGHSDLITTQALVGDFSAINTIFATSDSDTPTSLDNILLPLADNGGPTKTHALAPNSPAIDAATDGTVEQVFVFTLYVPGCRGEEILPATPLPPFRLDQRGVERPIGGACDIGAYEAEGVGSQCYVVKSVNDNVVVFCL